MLKRWKLVWVGFLIYVESDYLIGVVATYKVWDIVWGNGNEYGSLVGSVMIFLNICHIVDIPHRQSISKYCWTTNRASDFHDISILPCSQGNQVRN